MDSGLYVVSTPIGNLADMTERARDALREADVVYAEDTRRTGRLLARLGSPASLRSLHEHNEAARIKEVLERLENAQACALVSDAGTPVVSDPGARVVRAVLDAGHDVVPLPGPSAVTAALAASGFSGDRFAFLGFPPRKKAERAAWIELASRMPMVVVLFESPLRVGELLRELTAAGLGDRRCTVCRELTKLHETIRHGTIAELVAEFGDETKGELTIVLESRTEPADWEERREEIDRAVVEWASQGMSTRDVQLRLADEFGVPRNAAYRIALRHPKLEENADANERGTGD